MDRILRIMVVEDDVLLCQSLEIQIGNAGHCVMGSYGSFNEVQECTRLREVDLAVVDYNLGSGGKGTDIAAWLHEAYSTPCVYLTANAGRINIHAPGTIGLIEKPYSYNCLKLALDFLYRKLLVPPPKAGCPSCLNLSPIYQKAWLTGNSPSTLTH